MRSNVDWIVFGKLVTSLNHDVYSIIMYRHLCHVKNNKLLKYKQKLACSLVDLNLKIAQDENFSAFFYLCARLRDYSDCSDEF